MNAGNIENIFTGQKPPFVREAHDAFSAIRKVGYVVASIFVALGVTGVILAQPGSVLFFVSISGGGCAILSLVVLLTWSVYTLKSQQVTKKNKKQFPIKPAEVISTDHSDNFPKNQKNLTEKLQLLEKEEKIFVNKNHVKAKHLFTLTMRERLKSAVCFPCAKKINLLNEQELANVQLESEVFQISETIGIEKDIPKAAKDHQNLHIFQVASQYNAAEAPTPFTPPVGKAMEFSEKDYTQGPLAQRTNPDAFELVTAFLANLGFNMLHLVLPSVGETYEKQSSIEHGLILQPFFGQEEHKI